MGKYSQYKKIQIPWNEKIPFHWNKYRGKKVFSTKKEKNTGNIESNILSLTLKGVIKNDREKPIGLSPSDYSTYQIFEKDDLVFKLIDLNNISTSRVGLVPERGIMSSAYIRLTAREDLNIRYFYLQYYDLWLRNIYNGLGAGVRQTLSAADLLEIEIVVPPRDEQDHIVGYLDWQVSKINKLILAKKKQISLLLEHRQIVIDETVLKSCLEDEDENSKAPYGLIIPENWSVLKFNGFFKFFKGLGITKADLVDEGVSVISYGQVHSKLNTGTEINDSLIRFVDEKYLETSQNSLVKQGDFIFADTSEDFEGVGNCVFVNRDTTIFAGYHTLVARPKDGKMHRYLAYLFMSSFWRYQLRKSVNGVKVYSVTQKILKNAFVLLPPDNEQKEIVEFLDERCRLISNAVEKINEELVVLEELKKKLISDVVTGQIDVRDVEVPEFEYVEEIEDPSEEDEETDDESLDEEV